MARITRYTLEEKQKMAELYQSGMSLERVANALGRSLYGVYYRLKKTGVRIRTSSETKWHGGGGRLPGFKITEATRRNMSASAKKRGSTHNWFVDGNGKQRDAARKQEMDRLEYRLWREFVFTRDNFTCQECGQRGGALQADHVRPWKNHPEARYDKDNGRTLCRGCHFLTPTYGGKIHQPDLAAY